MTPAQLTGTTDSHLQSTMVGQKAFLMHPDVANDLLNMIEEQQKRDLKWKLPVAFETFLASAQFGMGSTKASCRFWIRTRSL